MFRKMHRDWIELFKIYQPRHKIYGWQNYDYHKVVIIIIIIIIIKVIKLALNLKVCSLKIKKDLSGPPSDQNVLKQ